MAETNGRRYVVIVGHDAAQDAQKIASELNSVPGVEVSNESPSFVDIVTYEEVLNEVMLKSIVSDLGAELHIAPEAQLIDPVPTRKIP